MSSFCLRSDRWQLSCGVLCRTHCIDSRAVWKGARRGKMRLLDRKSQFLAILRNQIMKIPWSYVWRNLSSGCWYWRSGWRVRAIERRCAGPARLARRAGCACSWANLRPISAQTALSTMNTATARRLQGPSGVFNLASPDDRRPAACTEPKPRGPWCLKTPGLPSGFANDLTRRWVFDLA
jgi:hypothetical protein